MAKEECELVDQNDTKSSFTEEHGGSRSVDTADSGANASPATLEDQVANLRSESAANYDKYLRAMAELENVKKRAVKERSELIKYGGENLARDLLEVVDNLERAIQAVPSEMGESAEFLKGVKMIFEQFTAVLERHSISGERSVGKPFDPQRHEAVASLPSAEHPEGTVVEEYRRAYYLRDKLLRPAQVVVAKPISSSD